MPETAPKMQPFFKATRPANSAGGFFITGTDTDVGKTFVAGCIAHTLIQQGFTVIPRKPIASGCIRQSDGRLLSEDALFLQSASQNTQTLQEICPHTFEPPISPQTAIEQAGLFISTTDLIKACNLPSQPTSDTLYLVEGAGGFYSPLCSDGLNQDLAKKLKLPVVLVVKNQLGCINHTLLSLAAIEQAGLKTAYIILNYANETNHLQGIENWTNIPILKVPFSHSQTLLSLSGFNE